MYCFLILIFACKTDKKENDSEQIERIEMDISETKDTEEINNVEEEPEKPQLEKVIEIKKTKREKTIEQEVEKVKEEKKKDSVNKGKTGDQILDELEAAVNKFLTTQDSADKEVIAKIKKDPYFNELRKTNEAFNKRYRSIWKKMRKR